MASLHATDMANLAPASSSPHSPAAAAAACAAAPVLARPSLHSSVIEQAERPIRGQEIADLAQGDTPDVPSAAPAGRGVVRQASPYVLICMDFTLFF